MWRPLSTGLLSLSVLLSASCTSVIHSLTDEPVTPDPGKTTLGTDLNDWQIKTYVGVNIKKAHSLLESAHVSVHSHNGVVLLTGEVPSAEMRTLAGTTARNFRGVRQVHNELQVQGPSSLLARTNDSWLSAKLRTRFIAEKAFDGSDIKIVVANSVIYLMGIVSHKRAKKAALIASTTGGVKRVVKVFEYTD